MNKLTLSILFLTVAVIVKAQEDPIFTDRPNVTDAVSLIAPGTFQVELGYFNNETNYPGATNNYITVPNVSFKYGLIDRVELRILTNYVKNKNKQTGNPNSEINGLSPITFSPKFALIEQNGFIPKTALATSVTFTDTGKKEFQVDETNYGFRLLLEYGFGKISWTNSFGTDWPKTTDQVWQYTTVGGYSISDNLSAFVEIYGSIKNQSNPAGNNIDFGFNYVVTNNFQIDFIYGVNLDNETSRMFGFGLAWNTNLKN